MSEVITEFYFLLYIFLFFPNLYSEHILLVRGREKKIINYHPLNLYLLKAWKEMHQVHDPDDV